MTLTKNIDKSFFATGFDAETIFKLDLYSEYLQEWLPVPLSGKMHVTEAVIFDLFCGPGVDANGTFGSPLRARDVVLHNENTILNSNVPLRLVFNDYDKDHIVDLRSLIGDEIVNDDGVRLASVEYHSKPFQEVFPVLVEALSGRTASLFFVDQFGATSIGANEFQMLHSLKTADVLFYIATNWFRRFSDMPEASDWGIPKDDIMKVDYRLLHKFMVGKFKEMVGEGYHVAPFSLKKGANIYGLIFASHDSLGLDKFLRVAWRKDPQTGEANYDLFGEGTDDRNQSSMFDASKVVDFRVDLRNKILDGHFSSDKEIFLFTLESGFVNRHAKPIVSELATKVGGQIEFRQNGKRAQPRLSRDCIKEPRELVLLD